MRTPKGDFRAFDATCTHLDCTVQYKKDMGVIWCACHNGKYDLNGRNISGPPPRPLIPFKVIVQGDEIFVSKQL
ncbi:MAG: Ubiquinol-cytochrome C reductase iron-sulfur subunit [Ignavibacteriae bacterium]|nr:MAG: Ubiquinol-cytochrome C reductase iron-sulfur subunit [Ignavibacteriota bacterium]